MSNANHIKMFQAVGDEKRHKILELLQGGAKTVGEIADELGYLQPQTSKHLKILHEAGLVRVEAVANKRFYHLEKSGFIALQNWLSSYIQQWEDQLDRLEAHLKEEES
ncbi:ArsR/SmtB family transcription factor [Jeotgalibacillus sp. JSM ZJ347]|uniref:ArsR/SmtB family transcription factor n=1 Tax=Jeotgalibacillus sp. JSM ZJ347 TaxID=3342117 RepID=UPI0035A817FB